MEKWSRSQLDGAIEGRAPHTLGEAERVGRADVTDETLWRITFAILSANARFEPTCMAYLVLRRKDVDWGAAETLRTCGVSYHNAKSAYLNRLWYEKPRLEPQLWDVDAREWLAHRVWGLSWAKASYAVMLLRGRADVCCIDTHMYAVLTGEPARKSLCKREYLYRESQVRELAIRHQLPCSVVQHAIWDEKRGKASPLLPEVV